MAAPTVDEILDHRRHPDNRRRDRFAVLAAFGLHVVAVTAAVLLPLLTEARPQPPRILPVRLVPMQRQGRVEAPPKRPQERRPPRPEPKAPEPKNPTPPPPEPVPETEPEKEPEKKPETPAPEPEPDRGRLGAPEGNPLGTTAFGARISGVDPSFTYDSYLTRMLARIETEWRRPTVQGTVEAVLHFVVDRDGTVRDLRVVETSGNRPFDLAAVRAVQNASPLPPLPHTYRKDSLGVNLIVR
jgi:TonB family protein